MKHFDKYCELIDSGQVLVCDLAKLSIERVKRYKQQYIFKQSEVDKRIKFIEEHCSNTKGASGRLKLALPQKVWLETAWGFYHEIEVTKTNPDTLMEYKALEERRLINEIPVIVPRGTGKTTLGSAIGLVGQLIDGEYGADVQLLAYSREQAGYLFNACRAMTSNDDTLVGMLRQLEKLRSTKQGILFEDTNSLLSIKTSDYESLDGTNAHYNIFDEVHTYDEDFIKVVNDGSSRKRQNWMTWYLSTNGTKRDRLFDKYFDKWVKILKGSIINDAVMPWVYQLNNIADIHNPKLWQMAMPLLGITTSREAIAKDIEMSANDPAQQAELMAKTFNLPINNYLAYFTNEECKGNAEKFDFGRFKGNQSKKAYCVLGIDLSRVDDICSVSFMIPDGDERYFYNLKFAPRQHIETRPKAQRDEYFAWEANGHLHLHELDHNCQEYIFDYLVEFMTENDIFPIAVGLDAWNSDTIRLRFKERYGVEATLIAQTVKGLSNHLKIYKTKIKVGKIIFDDPISCFCHMNVVVKIDANQNVFANKKKAKEKIDVFASQLDAFACYENEKENLSYYFEASL